MFQHNLEIVNQLDSLLLQLVLARVRGDHQKAFPAAPNALIHLRQCDKCGVINSLSLQTTTASNWALVNK